MKYLNTFNSLYTVLYHLCTLLNNSTFYSRGDDISLLVELIPAWPIKHSRNEKHLVQVNIYTEYFYWYTACFLEYIIRLS